ncbi:hypothetical protein ACVB8X_27440 [Streptomyces sp. NRAIS4]
MILPDRTSQTFAARLTAHRGTEITCRDRASADTKAIKDAPPAALRWRTAAIGTQRTAEHFHLADGRIDTIRLIFDATPWHAVMQTATPS